MQILLTEVGLYVRLKYGPFLCVDSDLRWLLFKSHTTHFDPALENVMKFSTLDLNYSFSQVLRGGEIYKSFRFRGLQILLTGVGLYERKFGTDYMTNSCQMYLQA